MTVPDTIAAISTPPGEGAIALVRVSGSNAIGVADKIFNGKEAPSQFETHACSILARFLAQAAG